MNWMNLIAFTAISLTLIGSSNAEAHQENSDVNLQSLLTSRGSTERNEDERRVMREIQEVNGNNVESYIGVIDNNPVTCESMPKKTFDNIDYSFMGYDVMHGYPMALGRDPGYRELIFAANYDTIRYNSGCRYIVPKGMNIVHDVSCDTSFSSKEAKTHSQVHKALSVSANIEGGGWGASFSASAGYKESKDTVKDRTSVIILSEAMCKYFYTRQDRATPPPLHPGFIADLIDLRDAGEDQSAYISFIGIYGTHFMKEINYGARYVFRHKMSMSNYQTATDKSVSVAVQASYSGLYSVSGGFSLDSDQRQAASDFSKSVETTTVTIGAPPSANGDANTWASSVKENPMPMEYKLTQLDKLFTWKYMTGTGIHQSEITVMQGRMKTALESYCEHLKALGKVETCDSLEEVECDYKYYQYCYIFVRDLLTWDEASARCRSMNANLVKVQNEDKNKFVHLIAKDVKKRLYIGGTDKEVDGTWKWLANSAQLSYTNWNSGATNSANGVEDCAYIKTFNGKWDYTPCTTRMPSLCEHNRVKVYIVGTSRDVTFSQAKAQCAEKGDYLATLDQLQVAFDDGYELCACGWLLDGTAAKPVQNPRIGCEKTVAAGIRICTEKTKWTGFCYRS